MFILSKKELEKKLKEHNNQIVQIIQGINQSVTPPATAK